MSKSHIIETPQKPKFIQIQTMITTPLLKTLLYGQQIFLTTNQAGMSFSEIF